MVEAGRFFKKDLMAMLISIVTFVTMRTDLDLFLDISGSIGLVPIFTYMVLIIGGIKRLKFSHLVVLRWTY